jgi:toxin ParE1/3/4
MVKIIWTDPAIKDLNEIYSYIAIDSVHYAEITIEKFFDRIDALSEFPKIGRVVPEFENQTIRE